MPLIEAPEGWFARCNLMMGEEGASEELAKTLLRRWSDDTDEVRPPQLSFANADNLPFSWSDLIEPLVASDEFEETATDSLLSAYHSATQAFGPDLKRGVTWFFDLMPLRFVKFSSAREDSARSALNLLLNGMEKVAGIYPEPDYTTYQIFYQIYAAIANALVTELREPSVIESDFRSGDRLVLPDTVTLFSEIDRVVDRRTGVQQDAQLERWKLLSNRRNKVAEELFATLCGFNPDFERQRAPGVTPDTLDVTSTARLGYQRELDVPWYRLSYIVPMKLSRDAALAQAYLRMMNSGSFAKPEIELSSLNELPIQVPAAKLVATVDEDGRYTPVEHQPEPALLMAYG